MGSNEAGKGGMMKTREEQIAERREQMPKIHRANYEKAMKGRSLRAAVNSFCAECTMWQREEVRLCTSLACPLWPYRPYQEIYKQTSGGPDFSADSTNLRME